MFEHARDALSGRCDDGQAVAPLPFHEKPVEFVGFTGNLDQFGALGGTFTRARRFSFGPRLLQKFRDVVYALTGDGA